MSDLALNESEGINWKTKTLIGGAVVGAVLGLFTAFLLSRTTEEKGDGPPEVHTMDILKVGISIFTLIRSIAALGD